MDAEVGAVRTEFLGRDGEFDGLQQGVRARPRVRAWAVCPMPEGEKSDALHQCAQRSSRVLDSMNRLLREEPSQMPLTDLLQVAHNRHDVRSLATLNSAPMCRYVRPAGGNLYLSDRLGYLLNSMSTAQTVKAPESLSSGSNCLMTTLSPMV